MEILRTPDERFADLPGFPFAAHYVDVGGVKMAFVNEGPPEAAPVLMLHGEPSWSYLYRKMIPLFADAGHRAMAPDLIGFGRSDKPAAQDDYTYARHTEWVERFILELELTDITLVCQDWGGLIGLRLVAMHPDRFARVVAANTFLPTGREPLGEAFFKWRELSQSIPVFEVGRIVAGGCATQLPPEVVAAYDAPFPDESYKAGARVFPMLVPAAPDAPGAVENQQAWPNLMKFDKPFLTAFSDQDPITRGADRMLQAAIPGARGQAHTTIEGGGHFLQEDRGPELARVVLEFIAAT